MRSKLLILFLSVVLLLLLPVVSFAQFGSLSGMVTDETTGYPIVGAAITLSGLYCVWYTDSAGFYMCDSIPAGAYIVSAYASGYFPQTFPDSVMVHEGQNSPNIDFALIPTGGETGSISGMVTDEVTGEPIVYAEITLSDLDCDCVWLTDSSGHYLCDHLPPGAYLVHASAQGYYGEIYPESVIVVGGQETSGIDFALTPITEFGSITGQVIDEQTGLPIIMARIVAIGLDNPCQGVGWSDTGGWYGIPQLAPGIFQVIASKEGYAPEVYPDSVIVVAGENTPGINFALEPIDEYGSISGMVTDEETGDPISMAHIVAIGLDNWCYAEAWSQPDGHYIIPHLCPGIYQVNANKMGYLPETYPDSVLVIVGQNTPDIDFALVPEGGPEFGSISGWVTDEQTGVPLPMTEITITGLYCVWYTDTAGYYLCDNLTPGSYEVNAHKAGYIPETYPDSVIVMPGQNTPNINFELGLAAEYGSISGRVTDEETGLPIVMAHLVAIGLDNYCFGEAWSDTGGYYQIPNLCAGIYGVHAEAAGYVHQVFPDSVGVIAGQNTPGIDFALEPVGDPGSISGIAIDSTTGDPIPHAYVWAYGEFCHGYALTNLQGEYTIPGLHSGDYFVTAWAWGYHPQDYPTMVTVEEGEGTPGIDFALIPYGGPGQGIIAGSVFEDTTFIMPIPFAIVVAVSWNGNWGFDFTDSTGMYRIEGLHADDYYVFTIAPGYIGEFYDGVYTWEEATLVTPDAYDIDFYLGQCGSYEGRISGEISSEGVPIEEALVYAEVDGEVKGFARSSSGGGYAINGLSPGTYTVYASKVSYHDGVYPEPVQVGYGKVSGVDINLPPVQVGDANGNGNTDAGDVVYLLNYLYLNGTPPQPIMTGDVNGDDVVDGADIVYLINYLFRGGDPPQNP
jgi:hypothetical protein